MDKLDRELLRDAIKRAISTWRLYWYWEHERQRRPLNEYELRNLHSFLKMNDDFSLRITKLETMLKEIENVDCTET